MTLAELADYTCQKVGQTDTESVAACKSFLDKRYRMIWDGALWRDSLSLVSVTTSASDPWLLMPLGIERVLKLRVGDSTTVSPFDAGSVFDYDPTLFEDFGSSAGFMTFAPVVAYSPSATGSALSLLHNGIAGDDVGKYASVEIENTSGDTIVYSDLELGADVVVTGSDVAFVLRVSKPITLSAYDIFLNPPFSFYSFAKNLTSFPRRARIKLLRGPSTATACLILGKRACVGFGESVTGEAINADSETPLLRNIDNALLAYAQGDMLERQRQYSKAQAKFQEGQSQLQIALDLEKNQSAQESRIIPADIHGDGDWSGYSKAQGF